VQGIKHDAFRYEAPDDLRRRGSPPGALLRRVELPTRLSHRPRAADSGALIGCTTRRDAIRPLDATHRQPGGGNAFFSPVNAVNETFTDNSVTVLRETLTEKAPYWMRLPEAYELPRVADQQAPPAVLPLTGRSCPGEFRISHGTGSP
jgi:hypothetical protein